MSDSRASKKRRVDDGRDIVSLDREGLVSMSRDVSPPRTNRMGPKSRDSSDNSTQKDEPSAPVDRDRSTRLENSFRPSPSVAARNAALAAIARAEGRAMTIAPESVEIDENELKDQPIAASSTSKTKLVSSPFQLTRIRDLPAKHNINTITLNDILGHPLLTEVWQFNFLLSIPFIIQHFDPDTAPTIDLKIVHGFWKKDDSRRQTLEAQAAAVTGQVGACKLIAAHMPEMFGTHHTKMMVLFRVDGVAQVVIHTANMIPQDWTNLTQAVWRSPELPLLPDGYDFEGEEGVQWPVGSGKRFKADLMKYLAAYEGRARDLREQLRRYDFSAIRAALIGSVPSKEPLTRPATAKTTTWGWPGLKHILSKVPIRPSEKSAGAGVFNIQISSIATLTETWTKNFFDVLDTSSTGKHEAAKHNIIFPTAEEIRKSLDGYSSGDSIHMKIQSAAQQKQLQLLRPMMCHWHSQISSSPHPSGDGTRREALRNPAAPHIKTYIRFKDEECTEIEWAMITSANLSKPAWGENVDKNGQVRIASYEIGVVVWPELFSENDEDKGNIKMVPTFGKDVPDVGREDVVVVGVRTPYDLPLVRYGMDEVPWCATMKHAKPDWMGNTWGGYEDRM